MHQGFPLSISSAPSSRRIPLIQAKRIAFVGVSLVGFGLAPVFVSGGCSNNPTQVNQSEEAKAREQQELADQAKANDEAAKNASKARAPQ
jgi:hypothetical protein